jgi:hypothetical protein
MHRAGACTSSSGFRHRTNRCAENPLGRTRSAGYLDGGNRHAVAAPRQVCGPGIFYRGAAGRIGYTARGAGRQRPACGAWNRGRRRRLLQPAVCAPEAHRHAHVDDCRSAQWPHSATDGGGPEDRCRRTGVSSCLVAIDRYMQEQIAGLCRGDIRSNPLAATHGASSSLYRGTGRRLVHQSPRWSGGQLIGGSLLGRRAA